MILPSKRLRDYLCLQWRNGDRMFGTMNGCDTASLFVMVYAAVRRFAFIDVGVPIDEAYKQSLKAYVENTDQQT